MDIEIELELQFRSNVGHQNIENQKWVKQY